MTSRQLINIDAAVASVEKTKPGDRRAAIQEYLRGEAAWKTAGGKALMQRRALFVTELRKKGLWA